MKGNIRSIVKKTIKSDRFKKIVKVTIILVTGVCIVLFLTTNIFGSTTIMAQTITTAADKIASSQMFINNFAMTDFNLLSDSNIISGLRTIGNMYGCNDFSFLKEVINMEKKFKLKPCELLALLSVENSFTDRTIVEADGITSYNVSQMRLATALDAHRILKARGINLPAPTDVLLRTDKHYVTELTAGYLQYLHEKFPNPLEAWTAYNAGMGSTYKFRSCEFIYQYTDKMMNKIQEFTSIMFNGQG